MDLVEKTFPLRLAALDSSAPRGTFEAIAVQFNQRDYAGDLVRPSCFSKSLQESGGRLPLLWAHQASEVLGSLDARADQRALTITGRLLIDSIGRAAEVYSMLVERCISGVSIGFLPLRSEPLPDGGTAFIEGKLIECSLVAAPAFDSSRVTSVHSVSTRLLKGLDRDALLSLHRSIDAMLRDGGEPDDDHGELLAALDIGKWR